MLIKLNVTIHGPVYVYMNGVQGPTGTHEPSNTPRPCPSGPTGSTGPSGPSIPSGPSGPSGPSPPSTPAIFIDLTQEV
jgi:hypothetical protein